MNRNNSNCRIRAYTLTPKTYSMKSYCFSLFYAIMVNFLKLLPQQTFCVYAY